MKKNYLLVVLFFLFTSLNVWSQVDKGIELFLLEDFEEAKAAFEKSVSQNPDLSYYYLGEIALLQKNEREAATYFEKGISSAEDAIFSLIGKTKLELKSNPDEFKKSMRSIANKNKKKAPVLVAVAQAYLYNNMVSEVAGALSMARSADKTYPYIYIFEGDRLKEKGESGNAATQYEQAINFDPKCVIAYIKNSMVYESSSPITAINTLNIGLEANPDNILLGKYLARIYYKNGYYERAITEYEKLNRNETLQSEDARNYAASLYFAGKYDEALSALLQLDAKSPNQPVIYRLLMYTHDKLKNYDAVITTGRKFFSLPNDENSVNYLVNDYTTLANALMIKGEIDESIEAYTKAIAFDPEDGTLSKELALRLASADRLADAAAFYKKFIEAESSQEVSDFLQLGIYYYRTASQFSAKAAAAEKALEAGAANQGQSGAENLTALKDSVSKYVSNAGEAFSKVTELASDSYQGYYWRANANTLIDTDLSKGLANDDYMKTIEILQEGNDADNQSKLIEAYRYFSIYYLYQFDSHKRTNDKTKAKEYADKVLLLKPDDDTSLKILEVLKN